MEDRFRVRAWDKKSKEYIYDVQECQFYTVDEPCGTCYSDYLTGTFSKEVLLEQCTGLKDKNGKLIYEGDIVNVNQVYNGIPTDKYVPFKVFYKNGRFNIHDIRSYYLEVIGNVHENLELLEESK